MRKFAVLIPVRESEFKAAGKTGTFHRMTGQNPVYLFAMERGGEVRRNEMVSVRPYNRFLH